MMLSLPTVSLAAISILCCIYICGNILYSGYIPLPCCSFCTCSCHNCCCGMCREHNLDRLLLPNGPNQAMARSSFSRGSRPLQQSDTVSLIFMMCITDILWNIFLILNWAPLTLDSFNEYLFPFWSESFCEVLGIYAQIASVQSPLWHLLLAYNLGYLLVRGTLTSLNHLHRRRCRQYLFAMITPILLAVLPMFFTKYGIYENDNSFDKECWIKSERWQLILISTVLLSLLVHYLVLSMLCCKYRKQMRASNGRCSLSYESAIDRLSRFVFVYTVIRILPAIERIWECFTTGPPPFWLICGHHWSVASIGIANALAWHINQVDPRTQWSSIRNHERSIKVPDETTLSTQFSLNSNGTVTGFVTTATASSHSTALLQSLRLQPK